MGLSISLKIILGASLVCLLVGCGHESAATQEVRSAASVDLECDPSVIALDESKPMQMRAEGCGRSLTYMYKCNPAQGGGQNCSWKPVRNDTNKL